MQGGVLSSSRGGLCSNRILPRLKPPLFLLFSLLLCFHTNIDALSNDAFASRIKNAQCAIQVSVGRIPGTAMPKEWAASGAKLGFVVEVEFSDESCGSYDMTKERLMLGTAAATKGTNVPRLSGQAFKALEPLNEPTFVSVAGQQTIKVTEGAYAAQSQCPQSRQYGLRFFLEFPEGAVRNDVELPAERIYFLSTCWIQNEPSFQRAQNRYNELEESLAEIQREIKKVSDDSRSKGIFGQAMGIRQLAVLVEKKKDAQNRILELEQTYPLQETTEKDLLDGPNDLLFAKEGVIAVKRFAGAMETREQYHWVGTFSFQEFFEDLDEEGVGNALESNRVE